MAKSRSAVQVGSGTNGIVVNVAATDNVLLDRLDIEGFGFGLNGVQIIGGGSVVIRRTSINHLQEMVSISSARTTLKVLIQDSVISNNGGGVNVQGAAGVPNNAV